jgi:hypothetical protein
VVKLVARDYADFGPTLASEYLEREHGLKLRRETVRQLLMRAGSWKAKPRKLKQVQTWRQRRSCRGELLLGTLQLASILSFAEPRRVANDFTIAWEGRRWQIPRQQASVALRGYSIRVEQRLDGAMVACLDGMHCALHPCAPSPVPQTEKLQRPVRRLVPPPGHSRWMQGFTVQ